MQRAPMADAPHCVGHRSALRFSARIVALLLPSLFGRGRGVLLRVFRRYHGKPGGGRIAVSSELGASRQKSAPKKYPMILCNVSKDKLPSIQYYFAK